MQITESSALALDITVPMSTTSPISGYMIHRTMRVRYGMRCPSTQIFRPEVQVNLSLSVW
jgi:hypothetical protein